MNRTINTVQDWWGNISSNYWLQSSQLIQALNWEKLSINTFKFWDVEFSICPERWGLIVSIKIRWKEILYMDWKSFKDLSKNVKWWIPVMFPNPWPLDTWLQQEYKLDLPQHWIARTSSWTQNVNWPNVSMNFSANEYTKQKFPYDFDLNNIISVWWEDCFFYIYTVIKNISKQLSMPVCFWLHPYFKVSAQDKSNIRFKFPWWEIIEQKGDDWINAGKPVMIDNPVVKYPDVPILVDVPWLGILDFHISTEYKRIWVWSTPGSDFFCFEPVMWDPWTLIDSPEIIKPWEEFYIEWFGFNLIDEE